MTIVLLLVLGLVLGSFVNALVWRLHEQRENPNEKGLSILRGRSLCPACRHNLTAKDLVPVMSWLFLGGKCRYCGQPIAWQYPVVEAATAGLFVASYVWWPQAVRGAQVALLGLWLALVVGLVALALYDLKWLILPNRIIYPLGVLALPYAAINVLSATKPLTALMGVVLAVVLGGGIFYLLFQLSGGKWIGGGDVRLGWLLGLVAGTPAQAVLFIFMASLLGSLASLPLIVTHKLKRGSLIPFGPLLIAGTVISVLFGPGLVRWYSHVFLSN